MQGQEDTRTLAELARGTLRRKILVGRDFHRFVLAQQLACIRYLDEAIKRCNGEG